MVLVYGTIITKKIQGNLASPFYKFCFYFRNSLCTSRTILLCVSYRNTTSSLPSGVPVIRSPSGSVRGIELEAPLTETIFAFRSFFTTNIILFETTTTKLLYWQKRGDHDCVHSRGGLLSAPPHHLGSRVVNVGWALQCSTLYQNVLASGLYLFVRIHDMYLHSGSKFDFCSYFRPYSCPFRYFFTFMPSINQLLYYTLFSPPLSLLPVSVFPFFLSLLILHMYVIYTYCI